MTGCTRQGVGGDQLGGCQTFVPCQETSCFLGVTHLPLIPRLHGDVFPYLCCYFLPLPFGSGRDPKAMMYLTATPTPAPSCSLRLSALFCSWLLCIGKRFLTT